MSIYKLRNGKLQHPMELLFPSETLLIEFEKYNFVPLFFKYTKTILEHLFLIYKFLPRLPPPKKIQI